MTLWQKIKMFLRYNLGPVEEYHPDHWNPINDVTFKLRPWKKG